MPLPPCSVTVYAVACLLLRILRVRVRVRVRMSVPVPVLEPVLAPVPVHVPVPGLLLRLCVIPCHTPLRAIPASLLHYRSCVPTLIHMYEPPHERPHVHSHRTPRIPQATGRPTLSPPLSLFLPSPPAPSVLARYFNGVPSKNLLPYTTRVASGVRCVHSAWPPLSVGHGPEHLNSPANTYYQSPPSDNNDTSLVTTHWGRVPSVHRVYYPALAWPIQFRAYAMPSVPVPPITLI